MSNPAQVQMLAAPLGQVDLVAGTSAVAAAPTIMYQVVGHAINNSLCLSPASLSPQSLLAPSLQQQYFLQSTLHMPNQGALPAGQQWAPQQQQQQQLPSTIFFAGVTPVADGQRLRLLFSQYGTVCDINLFRPYSGCRTSKGCGLVVFSQHSEAAAALEALNGKVVWPGARSPMVIEWCDSNKQHKKKRAQPLAHTLMHQSAMRWQLQQPQQQLPAPSLMPAAISGAPDGGLQVMYVHQPMFCQP